MILFYSDNVAGQMVKEFVHCSHMPWKNGVLKCGLGEEIALRCCNGRVEYFMMPYISYSIIRFRFRYLFVYLNLFFELSD